MTSTRIPTPVNGGADPEGQNAMRAERGFRIAQLHQQMTEESDVESTLIDMVADLLHYAVQMGVDPEAMLRVGVGHFNAETEPQSN